MHRLCLVLLAISIIANDIRISEVMSNPQGSEYENEFVELYNGGDHVMQINGWILSDGTGIDTLVHLSGPHELRPGDYAVIVDPSYDLVSGPYQYLRNDSVSIYTISTDASFGSGGLSNSGESVLVHSPDTLFFSSMTWTSSTSNGYSWERVSVLVPDSLSEWEESQTINGTPGYRNSVTPPLVNLKLAGARIEHAVTSDPVEISITVMNTGEYVIPGFSVQLFLDDDQNGLWEIDEYHLTETRDDTLASDDSLEIPITLFELRPGRHHVQIHILAEGDEVNGDDSLMLVVQGKYPKGVVSVTEVMFSPAPDQGGEWIEIQNRITDRLSLQGWTFSDANQTRHVISDSLFHLEPKGYLTLCASTEMKDYFGLEYSEIYELQSWPTLNSTSDSIRLFDPTGEQVASAFYRGSWGEPATSLERRNPATHPHAEINWMPSSHLDGGTPSRMNTRSLLPVEIQIEFISVRLPKLVGPTQAEIRILFRNMGMNLLTALELDSDADIQWLGNLPSYDLDSLVFMSEMLWPGFNQVPIILYHESGVVADTSVQIILGFPQDQIALNEIHYIPHEDQPEFLEFVNISSQPINLLGWCFQDRSGSRGEVIRDLTIQPDSLFIWTEDEVKLSDWVPPQAQFSGLTSWPSLNNSSDSIVVHDPTGKRMLAHAYENPSNGMVGRSLERRALWKPQSDPDSWGVCQGASGITPGLANSILLPANNLMIQDLSVLDTLLRSGVSFSLQVVVSNTGTDAVPGSQLDLHFSGNGNEIMRQSHILPFLSAGESYVWTRNYILDAGGWISLDADVQAPGDQNPGDNHIKEILYFSEEHSPLVINEVMPLPAVGEHEWSEIYNSSEKTVDLMGWSLSDQSGSAVIISDTSLLLHTREYLVIGEELSNSYDPHYATFLVLPQFPTLNNTEDGLVLFDPQGFWMDEMAYTSTTELVRGRSLERIRTEMTGLDPGNWSVCIYDEGSTPGWQNSLYLDVLPSELNIVLEPNPFSPDGDGQSDQLAIYYELPFEHGVMSVMIFDMAGRIIAEPVQIKPVSHRGQVFWDGEANYGGKAVTGLYIMKVLFDDQAGKVWNSLKKVYLVR